MEAKHATLIIVGGGVTGLALANMLEQACIDFLLLEQGPEIAPNVGASMIIGASGGRILHQLGCSALIDEHMPPDERVRRVLVRDKTGKTVVEVDDLHEELFKRSGYGFIPLDRHTLTRSLYDNLRDKSKVRAGKRITFVENNIDGVQLHTQDGDLFSAELIVGADGIHSTLRKEMWRMASITDPHYFLPKNITEIPTDYCCIFGVSKPISRVDLSSIYFAMESNYSWVVLPGPKDRIYWLLFHKLPERISGLYDSLPRYSLADRDRLIAEHLEDQVADGLCFQDLWDAHQTATLTPLPTFVLPRWYYGRMMMVGDAVHKFHPLGGQGANSAIETCAALTNHLQKLRNSKPKGGHISHSEAREIFYQTQVIRKARVTTIMKLSNLMQSIMASDGPVLQCLISIVPRAAAARMLVLILDDLTRPTVQLELPSLKPAPGFLRPRSTLMPVIGSPTWLSLSMAALLLLGVLLLTRYTLVDNPV